tara:strand:- start:30 stop:785 length:756 start_codon:yes stop_codon:yes gene_type:complete
MIKLHNGDCLEVMKTIESGSIDAIITDPPYGTTTCKWDSVIDFNLMWEQLNRIIKPNGAIVLFGSEPFSSALRMSNINNYKYDWIWEKDKGSNIGASRKQPLKKTENIIVFYSKQPFYNYKGDLLDKPITRVLPNKKSETSSLSSKNIGSDKREYTTYTHKTKTNVIYSKRDNQFGKSLHPTQKPVALMEYLIKTYTKENETVLDFTMGSGSTGVACKNTNRNFIGIEQNEKYFKIAKERIEHVPSQQKMF